MEEVRRVGNRTLIVVHRFEREGEERLVMAYRTLEDKYLVKGRPNIENVPDFVGEHEPAKPGSICAIGQEVIS